jgi:hypothetical protein
MLVSGCQTFRPRGYEPPKDSYEYVMQRDRVASNKEPEYPDTWVADLIVELLKWATHSGCR